MFEVTLYHVQYKVIVMIKKINIFSSEEP